MISFDDPKWDGLLGGYRVPYDPRNALLSLAEGRAVEVAWAELWNELHHQGDVGEASYAAVPELVRIHAHRRLPDWNTYGLVAIIEDAKRNPNNPQVPSWLCESYDSALRQLVKLGLDDFQDATEPELINGIIAVLAMGKGQHLLGRLAIFFTDDERRELFANAGWA
jgi:hypothetical protein